MPAAVESMAWVGQVPWHGLGKEVRPDISTNKMLKEAGLNWTVGLYPLYYKLKLNKYTKQYQVPKRKALVRETDASLLSVVGDEWQPTQNEAAFNFFKEFVDRGEMEMHTAGSLKGGQWVWCLAKVKESFTIRRKDRVQSYLLFSLPHIYGRSIDIRFTAIRAVCWNTLMLALAQSGDLVVKVHHRQAFDPELVKQALGVAHRKLGTYKEQAEFLAEKPYSQESVTNYINEIFPFTGAPGPKERQRKLGEVSDGADKAMKALETQPGADIAPETWWNAYNACTFTVDHLLGRSADTRIERAWYGGNRDRKVRALELAVEYAKRA